jgi:hypothetical protein
MTSKRLHVSNRATKSEIDDLKLIKGIGVVLETRLHEAGIFTYSQLSSLPPEKIANIITGLSVKRITKEKWINQAHKLARNKRTRKYKKAETAGRRQHYVNFTLEFLLDEKNNPRRIRVVHVQSGESDNWPGWDAKRLIDFLGRFLEVDLWKHKQIPKKTLKPGRQISSRNKIGSKDTLPPSSGSTRFPGQKITGVLQLRNLQVIPFGSDSSSFVLQQGQPFNISLILDLTKLVAPETASLNYKATIFAKKLGGISLIVGETSETIEFLDEATISIAGVSIPPGIYHIYASARIETKPYITAFLKGELLEVY